MRRSPSPPNRTKRETAAPRSCRGPERWRQPAAAPLPMNGAHATSAPWLSHAEPWVMTACLGLYPVFFLPVLAHALGSRDARSMFRRRHARGHRIAGAVHLALLLLGLVDVALRAGVLRPHADLPKGLFPPAAYDVLLCLSGLTLTLTAAFGFTSHRLARNPASGALEDTATITYNEMIEHSFYHGLNLAQVLYLHVIGSTLGLPMHLPELGLGERLGLLGLATLPWAVRSRFPVNSFSANYIGKPSTLIGLLYRLKKYQYILYKHFLLHGLNIACALRQPSQSAGLALSAPFRLYWVSLNAAYVLEFFLQTLVKKGHMAQPTMLALNQLLMAITTPPALMLLASRVDLHLAVLSLALNLANRGHDLLNVALTAAAGLAVQAVHTWAA